MITIIISKNNDYTPHLCEITSVDQEIVVPLNDGVYEYLLKADYMIYEDIMVCRVLSELVLADVKGYVIKIDDDVLVSSTARSLITTLTLNKNVVVFVKTDYKTDKETQKKHINRILHQKKNN